MDEQSIKNQYTQELEAAAAEQKKNQEAQDLTEATAEKEEPTPTNDGRKWLDLSRPEDPRGAENVPAYEGELGRGIVSGYAQLYNSVASIPQLFDKRFHEPTDPNNPWKYDAPWLIKNKPIMKTKWGGFIANATEMIAGTMMSGGLLRGLPFLKNLGTASKVKGAITRIGTDAVGGFGYDYVSNQSREANLSRTIIDQWPQTAGIFSPLATREDMSPHDKSVYNAFEGLGLGGFLGIAAEGSGWIARSLSTDAFKIKYKNKNIEVDNLSKAVDTSSDLDYKVKTTKVEAKAKQEYERSLFRKLKNRKMISKDVKIDQWRQETKPWDLLDDKQKYRIMESYASKNHIDWGEVRDLTRRTLKQGDANVELATEQLNLDLQTGAPRENPAYYQGGDVTDNQALAHSTQPVKAVRDMIQIRNNLDQKYGSPRGTTSEASMRRFEYAAPGTTIAERNSIAKALEASPAYKVLYGEAMPAAIANDFASATADLIKFMNDSGHSRLVDVPESDIIKYIKSIDAGKPTVIEGIGTLNKSQLVATDVLIGQMLSEARDLSKAALSVADQIDTSAPGSLLDGILARYAGVARLRKEVSMLSSFELRKHNAGGKLKETIEEVELKGRASDAAANEVATLKQLLRDDVDDDMLQSFLHFAATTNGDKQSWKDLHAFFRRRLHGYRNGNEYQRNAILNEMATMGVNSMLSGPKTPMRALIGTGIGTIMRPVSTILGSLGDYLGGNEEVFRGAFANIAGMVDARNDALKVAISNFQTYGINTDGWRNFTKAQDNAEWRAMGTFFERNGTVGERAAYIMADSIRDLNRLPIFDYGPRIMSSLDAGFTQLIGRGRLRQLAFNDVYSRVKESGKVISDTDFHQLQEAAEGAFESKVFDADGKVTDELALFAADEAKLTAELQGTAADFDRAFQKAPFLRPFFLFAKTGINALKMTGKHTPILNRFLKENSDIMTKPWDDPVMIRYGIKSAQDLEIAQATMRGRVSVGYMFTSTAALMALNGTITGNGPPDRAIRDSWIQQNWQPRSFKIGNKYVSYESLEPFNMFFSFVADVADSQKVMGEEWASDNFGKAGFIIAQNVTNKSFMAGLLQMQDILVSNFKDLPRVAALFANNQLPLSGLRNEVGKLLSPGMRELETGFWQTIGNRNLWADALIPGEQMPYKYDILDGSKIRYHEGLLPRLVDGLLPFNINVGTNETRELLFRSGLKLKQTFNTAPSGTSLEEYPDLKSRYQFHMGRQNIEAQLTELFKNPSVVESIRKMEKDRRQGRIHPPETYFHHGPIQTIFSRAKITAWSYLLADDKLGSKAASLEALHNANLLGNQLRMQGDYSNENKVHKQIKELEKMAK